MHRRELIREFCTSVAFERNLNVVIHPHPITEAIVKNGLVHFLGAAHIGGTIGVIAGISLAMLITINMRRRYVTVVDILQNEVTYSQMRRLVLMVERFTNPDMTDRDLMNGITLMIMLFIREEFDCEVVLLPRF